MQDILVALCVGAALYFVLRILWSKSGNPGSQGQCCGCSGCPNRSPLRDGTCANSEKHKAQAASVNDAFLTTVDDKPAANKPAE